MNIFAEAARLYEQNTPFALASIIETKGSAPRHDALLLIQADGKTLGTIGGGMMERYVIDEAIEAIREGKSRTVKGSMARSGKHAVGMDCGGAMSVHIDVQGIRQDMLLVGGGHVNRAVAHLAEKLGYRVTVADSWEPNLDPKFYPPQTRFFLGENIVDAIAQTTINDNTQVIVATNHEDGDALPAILSSKARQVGQLASRKKIVTLRKKCLEMGISNERFEQVRTPVGLDIGAESPEEIALSIMAEFLALSRNRLSLEKTSRQDMLLGTCGLSLTHHQSEPVIIRGAGDLASGTAVKLHNCGYKVVMLDLPHPTVIRTNISFASALLNDNGQVTVENITARKARNVSEAWKILDDHDIAVMADPQCLTLRQFKPHILIDAILAKQNIGTHRTMADITIGLGPGFTAGDDVDAVIETCRGHNLARIIYQGQAKANTGKPGTIMGYNEERVLRSPGKGRLFPKAHIGDLVSEGETVAILEQDNLQTEVTARISGKVRGMISEGSKVTEGFKIGDIDPRGAQVDHTTVSDKARAIAGGVLEAIIALSGKK